MSPALTTDNRFELTRRLTPLLVLFAIFLLAILGRLLYLQVVMGDELKKQSQVNRIQHEILPARRGAIYDRRGTVLAADEPVFDLVQTGQINFTDRAKLVQLANKLDWSTERLKNQLNDPADRILISGVSDEVRIWFAEHSDDYAALTLKNRPRRVYRYGGVLAHVIGYTGEINPSELNQRRREGLSQGKVVGKSGIEKQYDDLLQGENGIRWNETTASGDLIRVLDSPRPISPKAGDSLTLHLDLKLQRTISAQFPSDSAGTVVVMEVPSGNVMSLYSHPTFDPNDIVSGRSEFIQKLLNRPEDPLLNRAVHSRFPPGSTFKIIPFMAALRDSSFSTEVSYHCDGEYQLGDHTFGCWKEEGHGEMNLFRGLIHSCNVFFYKLVNLGIDYENVIDVARRLRFADRTNIDIPGEKRSQLSTPELKENLSQRSWTQGDALNSVIGQGYNLITPIKQAQLLSSLVAGRFVTPEVAEVRGTSEGSSQIKISQSVRESLLSTMDRVTDEGTGYRAQHDRNYNRLPVDLIGKTGTVQKPSDDDRSDTTKPDAWFTSAAPADNPRYVVVVFLSEAGSGGQVAAPFARRIYKRMIELDYFEDSVATGAT